MSRLKIRAPPEWGVEPVQKKYKILRGVDFFVLWSSLGVGLLVLVAGSLLVPGLSLLDALIVSLIGSIIGSILLASAGLIGARYGVPTMVSLRPILGVRGSYIPTALNVLQLVGWTAFELMIMGQAASNISGQFLGEHTQMFWIIIFALWCTGLAIGGPLIFVRKWLERVAIWLVYFSTVWITVQVFSSPRVWETLFLPGDGSLPILLALDLVIAMPISWWPLISDYNRFSSTARGGFVGTFLGYMVANTWFYFLGAALVSVMGIQDIISSIALLLFGNLALIFILVDETDNCFADIYSAAVSGQNILSKVKQWWLAVAAGAICFALAATVPIARYEGFLLFIGSVFSPLFGILAADYFVLRKRRYDVDELYRPKGRYWYGQGVNWWAVLAWALGILIYQAIARWVPWLGASVPSFLASFVLYLAFGRLSQRMG